MTNKIIFNVTDDAYNILLLENGKIVEFHQEEKNKTHIVGDVYVGTVKKIAPSLNAVFIDLGQKKDAFLHYSDLSPYIRSLQEFTKKVLHTQQEVNIEHLKLGEPTHKEGKIGDLLKEGDKIIVQVAKEAISTKGTRLSSLISLAGRYIILVPFSNEVSVSKKITNAKERARLIRLINSIRPHNFGVVVRTVAERKQVAELVADLKDLQKKWQNGVKALTQATGSQVLINELSLASSILRDLLNEHYDQLVIDDVTTYQEVQEYVRNISPEKLPIINLYQGKVNVFQYLGIERTLQNLFGEVVGLEGGGYLIIEHTEAMHVIDVNTGNRITKESDQESTALQVNLAAAAEVARQLRLRDLGGIIAIDFVGMHEAKHKKELYDAVKQHTKNDRAELDFIPLTRFGIMEITRRRVRPAMYLDNKEQCPNCLGSGKIAPAIQLADQLEQQVALLLGKQKTTGLTLYVHPYLYAYLNRGWMPKKWQWFFKYWKFMNLVADEGMPVTNYKILNNKNELVASNPQMQRLKTPAAKPTLPPAKGG